MAGEKLVVFSDDWGRHPSSCQHIVRRLLASHQVLWVNTVGTRLPTLSLADAKRVIEKVKQWAAPAGPARAAALPANLRVISPRMYPGFRTGWQRRVNAGALSRAVNASLGPREPGEKRVAITTLPITADLVGRLDVDRWVYYCVDDFSVWPGLDAGVMIDMERELAAKVDAAAAVSRALVDRLSGMGRAAALITHGIDLAHWSSQTATPAQTAELHGARSQTPVADCFAGLPRPIFAFWGLIDRRLDLAWCRSLIGSGPGTLVLIGPSQSPDPALAGMERVSLPGPMGYDELPEAAKGADVLVMPYAALPVTRAMQPLKFKEYLATGRPVVARRLPGIADWADAADLVDTPEDFARVTRLRAEEGVTTQQKQARERLREESWKSKALQLERLLSERQGIEPRGGETTAKS